MVKFRCKTILPLLRKYNGINKIVLSFIICLTLNKLATLAQYS